MRAELYVYTEEEARFDDMALDVRPSVTEFVFDSSKVGGLYLNGDTMVICMGGDSFPCVYDDHTYNTLFELLYEK